MSDCQGILPAVTEEVRFERAGEGNRHCEQYNRRDEHDCGVLEAPPDDGQVGALKPRGVGHVVGDFFDGLDRSVRTSHRSRVRHGRDTDPQCDNSQPDADRGCHIRRLPRAAGNKCADGTSGEERSNHDAGYSRTNDHATVAPRGFVIEHELLLFAQHWRAEEPVGKHGHDRERYEE